MKKYICMIMMMAAVLLPGCSLKSTVEQLSAEEQIVETEKSPVEEQAPVKIAVIDTGFSTKAIPEEKTAEGKNYLYPDQSTEDTYGHGTAVASIILEHESNVLLVPLVSNVYEDGKIRQVDNEVLAQMIVDAVDVYECNMINISAGLVLDKEAVRNAVAYAEAQGALIIASSGNDYDSNGEVKYYPAAYETVLAVGSLTEDETAISAFSQRGEWVDVYAVGENVTISTLSGNTRTSSGTSYSAAKITAVAAEYLQMNRGMSPRELREKVQKDITKSSNIK